MTCANFNRIAVLGASGMLGSQAVMTFSEGYEVFAVVRSCEELEHFGMSANKLGIDESRLIAGFDARNPESIRPILEEIKPDVVFNAAGIISQRLDSRDIALMIEINSVWPHALAAICKDLGARLIHPSTDCVFSGKRGMYKEDDVPDAGDFYGRSKLLGEVIDVPNAITIRTSIIGWQFGPQVSLAGWFAQHRSDDLKGFRKAVFSGLTTRALCETIRDYVLPNVELSGLYQVSTEPIDKYSLLKLIADKMGWQVNIAPVDDYAVDKSLDSSRFQAAAAWTAPTWDKMIEDLAADYEHFYK